jgi:hypothetical protein
MSASVLTTHGGGASGSFKSGNSKLLSSSIKVDVKNLFDHGLGAMGYQGQGAAIWTYYGANLWKLWLHGKPLGKMIERKAAIQKGGGKVDRVT